MRELSLNTIYEIVEDMPGNYMVFDIVDGEIRLLHYTNGIPGLSGYTKEEYEQIPDKFHLILEEDYRIIMDSIRASIDEGKLGELDLLFRMQHRQKGFIWVHLTSKKFMNPGKQRIYIVNLLEVTKETGISYAIMEASDRYVCVIEKATKRFLYANQNFYDLIDSNPAEAMGKHCYELLCKVLEMKDNNNCLCYSSINADPPLEMYNPDKKKHLTLTGREIVWGEYDAYVFYMSDITEKKLQDEQLEDSRKRLNVALENSDLMVWEYDIINNQCINSEKAGRDYNLPLIIENYPESLFETGYIPPETVVQIKEVKQRLLNGETGFYVERKTIDKFGKPNWQKVEYTLECDENGRPLRAIVCGMDITEKKELEQKYEEQMEYRNKFAENAMFSTRLDLDADTMIDYTSTNPILGEMARNAASAAEFQEKFFQTSVFNEESELSQQKLTLPVLKETYSLGQSQYKTIYWCRMLKLYLDLNMSMYKNPGNGHLELFFVITDATENILKQKALQSVVNKDYDFVMLIDSDTGKLMTLAHSEDAVMPKQSETNPDDYDTIMLEFATSHKAIYFTEEDYHAVSEKMTLDKITEKLENMPVYEFNCRTRGANGQANTYRLSFSYLDDSKKQIVFSRANITKVVQDERDVQTKLEKALKTAEMAGQAKTDFLSRMSHDMRTPMNGIIGMTHLTQELDGLPDEAKSNLSAIRESSDYLLQLINDTLDMNKIESNRFTLKPEIVHSGELLKHTLATVQPLADKKHIELNFNTVNADLGYLYADRVRLQQLFINILSNAVKFTKEHGRINLVIECLKREKEYAYDRMIVEDNGRGMSEEFLKHIFEPFSQERNEIVSGQEGTGLGMSIVKNLVEQMGGTIRIQSRQGVGTKVIVEIKLKHVYNVKAQEEPPKDQITGLAGKRILLVEDHPLNATISKRLLEKKEMLVEHAENGKRALEMYQSSGGSYYDAILMDIRMPVMNGLEATRKIRSLSRPDAKAIPIIAMTANAYEEDVKQAREAGMDAHLAKPVEPEQMYEAIQKMLTARSVTRRF